MTGRKLISIESTGLVTIRGAWYLVVGTHAHFILDYPGYDPSYDPVENATFRGGLAVVAPDDGFAYLHALRERVFPITDIESFIDANDAERIRPIVLIDFDNAAFVSSFFDLPMEDHAAPGWDASYEDLLDHVPDTIAAHWRPAS
ncbi:MAG: hypothetical protein AAFO29_16860 [Actinomycetota bacterium]